MIRRCLKPVKAGSRVGSRPARDPRSALVADGNDMLRGEKLDNIVWAVVCSDDPFRRSRYPWEPLFTGLDSRRLWLRNISGCGRARRNARVARGLSICDCCGLYGC